VVEAAVLWRFRELCDVDRWRAATIAAWAREPTLRVDVVLVGK
jgi:hypothetical protein